MAEKGKPEPEGVKPKFKLPEDPNEKLRFLAPFAAVVVAAIVLLLLFNYFFMRAPQESRCASALPEWRSACYNTLARETGKAEYCENVTDAAVRDACISSISISNKTPTLETCGKLSGGAIKDSCYQSLAEKAGSDAGCPLISNSMNVKQCYIAAAVSSESTAPCAKLSNESDRLECANAAYSSIAVERLDPEACLDISYPPDASAGRLLIDNCILGVAVAGNDTSICPRISDATLRARCVGTAMTDCGTLESPDARDLCFFTSAVTNSRASECASVSGLAIRDSCYYQLATRTFNSTLCGAISSENLKVVCIDSFGGR
ncbi:Uncharacterised protein [uncultured archaeon]|nr:Uncharacterised protein [uncultured archaeon]